MSDAVLDAISSMSEQDDKINGRRIVFVKIAYCAQISQPTTSPKKVDEMATTT